MQLLAELLPVMIEDLWKRKMIHTIMDTIQYYAPPPCENRPRTVRRLIPTSAEKEEMLMSDEDTLSKAVNVEWRAEYAALAAEIAEEIAAGGPRKKRKKKYKDNKAVSRAASITKESETKAISEASPGGTGEKASGSGLRSNVKSSSGLRNTFANVSFKIDESDSASIESIEEFHEMTAPKTMSRQNSRSVSRSFSRSPAGSRSNIGATSAQPVVPIISLSKNSFQSGVFQSSEFNLNSRRTPTPKSWRGEFISRRYHTALYAVA